MLVLIPLIFTNLVIIGIVLYWVIKIGWVVVLVIFYLWFGIGVETMMEFTKGMIDGFKNP